MAETLRELVVALSLQQMDEWFAAGKVMDGNLSIAAFLWPAVENLEGEARQAAAKELFAAQQKTIEIDEEMEAKFLDI